VPDERVGVILDRIHLNPWHGMHITSSIQRALLPAVLLSAAACVPHDPPRIAMEPFPWERAASPPEARPGTPVEAGRPEPARAEPAREEPPMQEPVAAEVTRDVEPPLSERWRSPFAVSSTGRTAPREGRTVVVIRGDSSFVAELRPAEPATALEPPAPAPRTPPSVGDGDDPVQVEARGVQAPEGAPGTEPVVRAEARAPEPEPVVRAETRAPESEPVVRAEARAPEPPVRAVSSPAAVAPGTHRVVRGDTWLALARRYQVSWNALAQANPGVDPDRIREGQVLRIPAAGTSANRVHQVGPGDTLSGLARRYNVSTEGIRRLNQLADDRIRLGQQLLIPSESSDR
jgi:LysM repeat protein